MPITVPYNRDRRRSSFTRPMRDHEEILEGLRSLKAAKRELGRTMSLSGDKRRESREYGYVASLLAIISPIHSFVRPSVRSSIRAIVCLSVRLSICLTVFHALVDLFLYSSFSVFLSFSLCLSYFLTTTVRDRRIVGRLDPSSSNSRSADRIFLVGRRRAYRTHANKCMCTDVHVSV